MNANPVIFGCAGKKLSQDEKIFMRDADPWGYILFARNIDNPLQVQRLVGELREAVGRDAAVFIDQEGGRVARLKQPHWREWTPVKQMIDAINAEGRSRGQQTDVRERYITQALTDRYHAIGQELRSLGIDVNCVPLLDVPQPGAHNIIGDRALGSQPETIISRANAVIEGCRRGGVMHIIKHIPGHGRANVDSHLDLPIVSEEQEELSIDFAPFQALAHEPMAMTAHIIYDKIDSEHCATCSQTVIANIIRKDTCINFQGLLMTDDLSMKALKGSFSERTNDALKAGCDIILHCNGDRPEMESILSEIPRLTSKAFERAIKVDEQRNALKNFDIELLSSTCLKKAGMTIDRQQRK